MVSIDEDVLRKNIEKNNINQTQINYLLSEIVFEKENKIPIDEKVARIKDSINEIGFKNTANIYSISNSAKFGGDIGWVSKNELSKVFLEKIATLEIGKIVGPIKAENSFVILKLKNIKEEKIKIDIKKELETMKEFEMNRQLNRYSKIYYKQIMINTNINEL